MSRRPDSPTARATGGTGGLPGRRSASGVQPWRRRTRFDRRARRLDGSERSESVIFSRSRGSGGRHHKVEDARRARHAAQRRTHDEFGADPDDDAPLTTGPYDILDAPDGVERLDLGSLKIPAVPGIEVRVAANPEGQVEQVVLVAGESAMQLGALAAPRTEGIW